MYSSIHCVRRRPDYMEFVTHTWDDSKEKIKRENSNRNNRVDLKVCHFNAIKMYLWALGIWLLLSIRHSPWPLKCVRFIVALFYCNVSSSPLQTAYVCVWKLFSEKNDTFISFDNGLDVIRRRRWSLQPQRLYKIERHANIKVFEEQIP